jgi:hypothetical protein
MRHALLRCVVVVFLSMLRRGVVGLLPRTTWRRGAASFRSPWDPTKQKAAAAAHDDLPEETLYIIDGTSMLYNAHFSRENQNYWREAYLSPEESAKVIAHWGMDRLLHVPPPPSKTATDGGNDNNDDTDTPVFDDSLSPILFVDDDNGQPTVPVVHCGALTTMLLHFARFIRDVRPRYVAMAFDAGRITFRNEMYPEYKQHRSATPVYLLPLLRLAPSVIEALGCRCFMRENYEADDVMASLSRWAVDRGMHVVHVSADKVAACLPYPHHTHFTHFDFISCSCTRTCCNWSTTPCT